MSWSASFSHRRLFVDLRPHHSHFRRRLCDFPANIHAVTGKGNLRPRLRRSLPLPIRPPCTTHLPTNTFQVASLTDSSPTPSTSSWPMVGRGCQQKAGFVLVPQTQPPAGSFNLPTRLDVRFHHYLSLKGTSEITLFSLPEQLGESVANRDGWNSCRNGDVLAASSTTNSLPFPNTCAWHLHIDHN